MSIDPTLEVETYLRPVMKPPTSGPYESVYRSLVSERPCASVLGRYSSSTPSLEARLTVAVLKRPPVTPKQRLLNRVETLAARWLVVTPSFILSYKDPALTELRGIIPLAGAGVSIVRRLTTGVHYLRIRTNSPRNELSRGIRGRNMRPGVFLITQAPSVLLLIADLLLDHTARPSPAVASSARTLADRIARSARAGDCTALTNCDLLKWRNSDSYLAAGRGELITVLPPPPRRATTDATGTPAPAPAPGSPAPALTPRAASLPRMRPATVMSGLYTRCDESDLSGGLALSEFVSVTSEEVADADTGPLPPEPRYAAELSGKQQVMTARASSPPPRPPSRTAVSPMTLTAIAECNRQFDELALDDFSDCEYDYSELSTSAWIEMPVTRVKMDPIDDGGVFVGGQSSVPLSTLHRSCSPRPARPTLVWPPTENGMEAIDN